SKSFSQLLSTFENKSTTNQFIAKTDAKFLQHFLFKADYSWIETVLGNEKMIVEQANAYLEFHKKENAWTFMIKGNNLLNTGIKKEISFSEDRKSTRLNSSHVKISYAV